MRQLFNIEAACCDIRCYENANFASLEVTQCFGARTLTLVAMDCVGLDTILVELLRQPIRAVLGPRKHKNLSPVAAPDHLGQQLAFAPFIDRIHQLLDAVSRGVSSSDLNLSGIIEKIVREITNLFRERRREQHVLPLFRQVLDDLLDVADEAHIEHAVRFIENKHLDEREIDVSLPDMI
jgi:hypothetical protein